MLDVCLLGCGGMMPLPDRWLTSLMVRVEGSCLLIDCGEGTQIALKEKGWSLRHIDFICLTHFHADHVSGLPGLLLAIGNADRTEPLTIVGPKGVERVVNSLRVIAPELPYPLKFIELTDKEQELSLGPYTLSAFRVNHNMICYGYTIRLRRAGRFLPEQARSLQIPLPYWSRLQNGETIADGEHVYRPEMVMGPERRGLKVTYCTDTRPVPVISRMARDADLFICEGMYGDPDKAANAREHKHMLFTEAAELALEADCRQLWLTHFSPSMPHPDEYLPLAREIFSETYIGRDGKSTELKFDDE